MRVFFSQLWLINIYKIKESSSMNRIVLFLFVVAHGKKSLYPSYHWIVSHRWCENPPQYVRQPCCNDDFNQSDWWEEDQWSTTLNRSVAELEPDRKQCVGGQRSHSNTHPRERRSVPQSHQAICRNGYGGGITSVMFPSCCYCRLLHSLVEGEKWCHVASFWLLLFSLFYWWPKMLSSI